MDSKKIIRIAFFALLLWNICIFSAPLFVTAKASVLQHLGTFFYFFLDPVCHQLPARSIFISGLPLPVCARCTFIYLGSLITFTFALFPGKIKTWSPGWFIGLTLLIALQIILEKLHLYENLPELRMAGGFLLGILLSRLIIDGLNSNTLRKGREFDHE